jgi:excisionase family DNA binding protein
MSNNIHERWLSRRELAERLGLPAKTLAQWAAKGTGPIYARMGRHVRYRLSDVLEWEAARVEDRHEAILAGLMRCDSERVTQIPRGTQRTEAAEGVPDDPDHL